MYYIYSILLNLDWCLCVWLENYIYLEICYTIDPPVIFMSG